MKSSFLLKLAIVVGLLPKFLLDLSQASSSAFASTAALASAWDFAAAAWAISIGLDVKRFLNPYFIEL